ncbi:ribonucleotide reductase inhibitor protein Sml1p [Monosporozyma servazzii]
MTTEEQKQQYLKEVNEAAERVKEHVKLQQSPQLQRQQEEAFQRVPLPGNNAPMLSLNATSGSGSTLEMWEESVDERLNKINDSELSNIINTNDTDF